MNTIMMGFVFNSIPFPQAILMRSWNDLETTIFSGCRINGDPDDNFFRFFRAIKSVLNKSENASQLAFFKLSKAWLRCQCPACPGVEPLCGTKTEGPWPASPTRLQGEKDAAPEGLARRLARRGVRRKGDSHSMDTRPCARLAAGQSAGQRHIF